ncbi:MAG: hypothetical protein AB7V46_05215 [Thermomicrobiales bacterium]
MEEQPSRPKRRLLLLNRDLMAGIAVANTAKALGLAVDRVTSEHGLVQRWTEAKAETALVVLDLNAPVDWEQLELVLEDSAGAAVIGFGPHVDIDGRRAAKKAGLTRIYSNGEFHRTMRQAIAKHAGIPADSAA